MAQLLQQERSEHPGAHQGMANAFAAQQIRGAHYIPQAHQTAATVGFTAADAAADQTTMAIDHGHGLPLGWCQQALDQAIQNAPQGRLMPAGVKQATNTQLQERSLHRKHPAVALGHPVAAEAKGQPITPTLPAGAGHLHKPLQTHTAHQWFGSGAARRRIPQQAPLLACGIDHPVAVNLKLTAIAPAQDRVEPIGFLTAGQGTVAEPYPGSPTLSLPCKPFSQGSEIQNHPLGASAWPAAAGFTRAQQLPAAPPVGHHARRQAEAVEGIEGKGGAAEGGPPQIGQPLRQQHILAVGGELPREVRTGGTGPHHQHPAPHRS